jgi:hypothetical protein
MVVPATTLATRHPELHDQIEQLVDLGWLVSVWELKSWISQEDRSGFDPKHMKAIEYNLRLLPIFLAGAAEDIRESPAHRWLAEFSDLLRDVGRHLDKEERHLLAIYEAVPKRIEALKHGSSPDDVIQLLHLAFICLDAMGELEQLPYPGDESVSSHNPI